MFDIIPFSENKYNVVNIAKMLNCNCLDNEVLVFVNIWLMSFHCKYFYEYQKTAYGYNNVKIYYITEY